jgi:hypothetical protein
LEREGNTAELERIRANAPDEIPSPSMQKLWRLLLAGRVKQSGRSNHDRSLYDWKRKLQQQGLSATLRFELRELLAPKIRLKKSWQFPGYEDDSTEINEHNIKRFIDWDIVLEIDNPDSSIDYLQQSEIWPQILPELLVDLQQLLRDALDLQRELGEADDLNDRSNWDLPSISPHRQNWHHHDWVSLIELLRDAWLELKKSDPARAAKIARDWVELPYPTFKRLAFYAATERF